LEQVTSKVARTAEFVARVPSVPYAAIVLIRLDRGAYVAERLQTATPSVCATRTVDSHPGTAEAVREDGSAPEARRGRQALRRKRCEYRDEQDPTDDAQRKHGWNLDEMPSQHLCSHEDQDRCQARMQVAQPCGDSGEEEVERP